MDEINVGKTDMASQNTECSCSSGCCGNSTQNQSIPKAPYIAGLNITAVGVVPRVPTGLAMRDVMGAWRVRWGFGRMSYTVAPGLYSVGKLRVFRYNCYARSGLRRRHHQRDADRQRTIL